MPISSRYRTWSKFYPFDSTHFGFLISITICQEIELISVTYNAVVLKNKSVKLLKIALLGHYLGKNRANMGHTQNQVQFYFRK